MSNITLPKTEYDTLKKQALAYQKFVARFFESLLAADSIKDVVRDFQKTGLYTNAFIQDLQEGLSDSSYLQTYGNQTVKTALGKIHQRASTGRKIG